MSVATKRDFVINYGLQTDNTGASTGNTLFVDQVNDRVGIGTKNPTERLEVFGNIKSTSFIGAVSGAITLPLGSVTAPSIAFTGDTNTGIYSPGADQVSITTNGTERLRINATGQVGSVSLGTAAAPVYTFTGDLNTGIFSPGADQVAISTNGTGRLFIDSSGRLGVGTSTPGVAGEFVGTESDGVIRSLRSIPTGILSVADHAGRISLGTSTGTTAYIGGRIEINGAETWTPGVAHGSNLVFSTVPTGSTTITERLRITSAGNVGIGTTNPLQPLHVQGNFLLSADATTTTHITQKAYTINNGTLSWEGSAGQLFSITNNLTSGSIFSVNDVSGIPSIDVDADGTIQLGPYGGNIGIGTTNPTEKLHVVGDVLVGGGVSATQFTSLSDSKYKTNVVTISGSLDKVEKLRGVRFDWKDSGFPSYGVIAEELQEVLPELVYGNDPKTVNYNGIIGVLIEAIKEQQIRIEKLENKLNVQ